MSEYSIELFIFVGECASVNWEVGGTVVELSISAAFGIDVCIYAFILVAVIVWVIRGVVCWVGSAVVPFTAAGFCIYRCHIPIA
jgi:hypothetical protein